MNIDFSKPISFQPQTKFEEKVCDFVKDWFSENGTVKIQTSGSTGAPKIFEVEKLKMLNSAKMTCDFLDLKEGNSALICLPIEYISGKMMVVRSIERKLNLHIEEPSTKPLENLHSEINFCAMTPLQVENSLEKIHFIKKLIIGGAEVSENLKEKILKKLTTDNQLTTKIYETYGMSETLSHIALKEIYPNLETYFKVLEGVEISTDQRGCLKIFAAKLNSKNLQTNDLVEIINENQFKFLGRIDNVINSGGAKIFPEELEKIIKKEIPNEVVFVGIPDEVLGQKLVLVIETDATKQNNIIEENGLRFRVQNLKFQKPFQKPKEIIFVDKIPRTPNGKIDRLMLKQKITSLRLQ